MQSDFPQLNELKTYLDSYTTGLQPISSIEAQIEVIKGGQGSMFRSGHSLDITTQDLYWESLESIGKLLKFDHRQIVPIYGLEHAVNQFIHAFREEKMYGWKMDNHSILAPMVNCRNFQIVEGTTSQDLLMALEKNFEGGVLVISEHSLVTGCKVPLKEIEKLVHEKGGYLITNRSGGYGLVNAVGDITIIDGSMSMLGPTGSGVALLSKRVIDELHPLEIGSYGVTNFSKKRVEYSASIDRFMLYPISVDKLVGLDHSLQYIRGKGDIEAHVKNLSAMLVDKLRVRKKVKIHSFSGSPFVTLSVDGWTSQELAVILSEGYNVHIRGGLLCSHMAVEEVGVDDVMQVSFHIYNTEEHIENFVNAIEDLT